MNPDGRRAALTVLVALLLAVAGIAGANLRSPAEPAPSPTPIPTPAVTAAPTPTPTPTFHEVAGGLLPGRPTCLVVREGATTLASHAPDTPFIPASTQKVLVAAAALHVLGPDHRFETRVLAPAAPQAGVVPELWLVGGADPLLVAPEFADHLAASPRWNLLPVTRLDALADRIRGAGIGEIGLIFGDDTRHTNRRYLETWKESYRDDVGPMSALTVNGGWGSWEPERVPVPDPPAHGARELTRLLRDRGVVVVRDGGPGVAPPDAVEVASISSAPLVDVLAAMLRSSHNLTAELVTRELGLRLRGQGTLEAGTQAVVRALADLGVATEGVSLVDGSGLDRGNRATCRALADTLDARPGGVALGDLLATAGIDGTLRLRLKGTPLEGRLRGKTGWIEGAVGMAGTLGPRTFAILQNEVPTLSDGRTAEERILALLAGG